jgi:hypothetical protein
MDTEKRRRETMPYWGADRRIESRPGVPRETAPHPLAGAHWTVPEQQTPTNDVLLRAGLERPTPVFGTAQPPHGLSGKLRRAAYGIHDWRVAHWMILLLADRVDVVESWIARLFRSRGSK